MILNRTQLSHKIRPALVIGALLAALVLLTGCAAETGDMREMPRYDPMEPSTLFSDGRSARSFPVGSVPQTEGSVSDPALTGLGEDGQPLQGFPAEVTAELVERGRERYDIYCSVCHGPAGAGDGRAVPFGMVQPPSLQDAVYEEMPEGQIFDVITHGFGQMFPYGYRVKPPDRWAVIAYLRALQLRDGPLESELSAEELQQIGAQP